MAMFWAGRKCCATVALHFLTSVKEVRRGIVALMIVGPPAGIIRGVAALAELDIRTPPRASISRAAAAIIGILFFFTTLNVLLDQAHDLK